MDEKTLHPRHPDRICWGCDKFCPASDLACGGGTIRTPHPIELFGDDWTPAAAAPEIAEAATTAAETREPVGAPHPHGS